jgi:hypothetical protein
MNAHEAQASDMFEAADEINSLHNELLALSETALAKAIRIGELLTEIKALLPHGAWLNWLALNVTFKLGMAQRYLRIFENKEQLLKASQATHLTDTNLADTKILGYLETDFLGNQPTNINVVSNSDTLRLRLYFVDLQHGPWEFLAGQDWSMLTPNRKGISPLPNDIFYTQDVDVNYNVGLIWERTPQFRLLYHPSDEWTLGISAENPDQYVGPAVKLPSNSTFDSTQVDNGSNGTATPNFMPDFIGKVAYDTKIGGHSIHADAAGIVREYKINAFVPSTGMSTDEWATGYGGSFNTNIEILPHLQLIENFYASNGAGREISTGVAPDFIVTAPDAAGVDRIKTVKSYAGLAGFEWDVLPVTKLYGYYGQTYIDREFSQLPNGSFVGYGFPGSPNTNNKRIEEYTAGLTQVLWKSERYGDLKLLLQYSYLSRDPWFVAPGTPSDAHMHMGYVDIRYDLP